VYFFYHANERRIQSERQVKYKNIIFGISPETLLGSYAASSYPDLTYAERYHVVPVADTAISFLPVLYTVVQDLWF
jgi:hypothetical protein